MYRSPNIIRRLIWIGYVARMEDGRSAFKMLTGKRTGKRPLGRPRRRLEDNIKVDLKESSRKGEGRSAFKILAGKPTEKRPLGRPRRTWEDNIRMNFEG